MKFEITNEEAIRGARFLTLEECDENIAKIEAELAVWQGLKNAIEEGYFVMYNDVTEKYRIVQPGLPCGIM